MGRGRGLKGHKRIASAIGEPPARNRPAAGGWDIGCICGWVGEHQATSAAAHSAYQRHIDHCIDEQPFRCKRCGVEKGIAEMRPDYRYICLACFSKMGNAWQDAHPAESARHKRNHHLLKKFGITKEEEDRLLAEQGGVCAICSKAISDKRGYGPHIDHDHATGLVRGILCIRCNNALGLLGDDPIRLRAAIAYLERWVTRCSV